MPASSDFNLKNKVQFFPLIFSPKFVFSLRQFRKGESKKVIQLKKS